MLKEFEMELLKRFSDEYRKASKKRKGEILNQYCQLAGCQRKTAIKRFRRYVLYSFIKRKRIHSNRRGPKRKYNIFHRTLIKQIWELTGYICAERIHPMIGKYIEQLEDAGGLILYPAEVIKKVNKIPLGTLKKIMRSFPHMHSNKHKGNFEIYKQVPIVANFGKYAMEKPGYVEVDYVEHNGGNSSGTFAITGVYTDIFSQWVVRASGLGKNLGSVEDIDKRVHQKIFHPIVHYHPDNDKSILKLLFERIKNNKKKSFVLSRSRPYKKNDNAHVEQKNGDKVRKLVGYFRYDSKEEVELLNQLYNLADLLDNFFIPSLKLKEKIKNSLGKVIRKTYDKPKTPYQRLMESKHIPEETKKKLKTIYHHLNMVKLSKEMNQILGKLFDVMGGKNVKVFRRQKIVSNKNTLQRHLVII